MATNIISKRFSECVNYGNEIASKKISKATDYGSGHYVDPNEFTKWSTKAKQLISSVCGGASEYFKMLERAAAPSMVRTNFEHLERMLAVVSAAAEDFEAGYLTSVKSLIRAEVFTDELEQAEVLLSSGYAGAAAVIAGAVIETRIRQLCSDHGIHYPENASRPSLNRMNDDLARSDVYNASVKKQVTWISSIRNSAAHGQTAEYTEDDVRSMIVATTGFLANHD